MTPPNPEQQSDEHWMARACELAEQGLFTTSPNPRVGCILVDPLGQALSEGFHAHAGGPHAEIVALTQAGARAKDATVYVTLEPCNHYGKTGPCTEALIRAGVRELVYGMEDPNPLVGGQGLQRLRDAGIQVRGPVLDAQVRALNPGFDKRMRTGLPYVRCKMAMSLDGRTAMASGESQWITGPEARGQGQYWRARSCAIVTGVGTVLADNPALTVRDPRFGATPRQPLRVVVDTRGRTPADAKVLTGPGRAVLAQGQANPFPVGAHIVWALPQASGKLDLQALVQRLGEEQCNEVLVEAGPALMGSFLQAGLVDELILFVAPKLLGNTAQPLLVWPISQLQDAAQLQIDSITPVGADWCIRARPLNKTR